MARVSSTNTTPELSLRRALHAGGLRYRLHARELPGKPDIVFRPVRLAIFVHGCFWHRHDGCKRATTPSTRTEYWLPKFERNVARDAQRVAELEAAGWTVMTLWECETRDPGVIERFVYSVQRHVRAAKRFALGAPTPRKA